MRSAIKSRLVWAVILAAAVFLILPFVFFLNGKLAYYAYKEATYATIVNHIVGSEKDPEKNVNYVMDYVYRNLFTPGNAKVIDKDVYNDFIRGIAWCDQRSWAMCTFLDNLGIPSRMIITRNPAGISCHVGVEALIDGRWRYLDVQYDIAVRGPDGGIISYEEICKEPSVYFLSPKMLMLKSLDKDRYENIRSYMEKEVYYKRPLAPEIWESPAKSKDLLRRAVSGILDFYVYLFGDSFSNLYQDTYMGMYIDSGKSDYLYVKARNYDLYNRRKLAISSYINFIESSPGDKSVEDALFFLGVLYYRENEYELSLRALQSLLKKYPNTQWKWFAEFYLGMNNQAKGDLSSAERYYLDAFRNSDSYKPLRKLYLMKQR